MKDKIIFLLNSSYPYYTGGRETWINNVANCLVNKYDVVVITENHAIKANSAKRWEIDSRIKLCNVNGLVSFKWLNKIYRSYLVFFDCFIKAEMMRKKLCKHIVPNQRTYIIAMDTVFVPLSFRGIKYKNPNVRTIISSRGPHAEIYSSYWPIAQKLIFKLEKKNLFDVDRIWSNGYDTQSSLKSKGFDSKIILNGVDCKKIIFGRIPEHKEIQKANGIKILTIGTLLDLKGYPTMISAMKELLTVYPELSIDLYAFGKGDPKRYLKLATDFGIENYIHFLGEDSNAPLYAKQADILLALGTSEGSGMSMAALEMIASGIPVIATDILSYQQLITDCENGFLVPEGDEVALAKKIYEVIKMQKEERYKIGKRAQEKVVKNDWSSVVISIEKELEIL